MALHVTYEVRWENFKGFKDTGWIPIKSITILLGPNNSGKTSFIAPLLLMNQTVSSSDFSTPLIIRGDMYDGGSIRELLHMYKLENNIQFGFKYHTHPKPKKLKKTGFYPPGAFEVNFGLNNPIERELNVKEESVYDIYLRKFFNL